MSNTPGTIGSNGTADTDPLAALIRAGNRRALAQAITLVESTREDHRQRADALITSLLPTTGGAIRIGITGAPGVGKSTFIEAFGMTGIARGHRVAVLAVDPSSERTGGSLLGDKTRMERLSCAEAAFVRPSPAGRMLGGIALRTREAMLLVEAAGYDVILIETVGVGQSETAVSMLVDSFLLLLPPAGGDELQGLKKGIVELADIVAVNKVDGQLTAAAHDTVAEYRHALALLAPPDAGWRVPVVPCSAQTGDGIEAIWEHILAHRQALTSTGEMERRRQKQARAWFQDEIREGLRAVFAAHPAIRARLHQMERAVATGQMAPGHAARLLLADFTGEQPSAKTRPPGENQPSISPRSATV